MITRKLPVRLTDEELLERGGQLADAELSYRMIDEDRKRTVAGFKEQLDATELLMKTLSNVIRGKEELRDVECVWLPNNRNLTVSLVRIDNNDTIETRPMTDEERQGMLI